MSVKTVLKMGNPRLLEVSEPIAEFDTPELHELIQDMQDTMQELNGAGLAAPQIGVLKRVVIFGVDENPRYPDIEPVPQTILINPEITVLTEETEGMWEGCLSVPGMRGYVERPNKVEYKGFDQFGNEIQHQASGFHAIVVQHECDHLDGILYPVRMRDMSRFGFENELV